MKNQQFVGRDKKERMELLKSEALLKKLSQDNQALNLLLQQKMIMKKLSGSIWNRFVCWLTGRNPIFTYYSKYQEYGSRNAQTGSNPDQPDKG